MVHELVVDGNITGPTIRTHLIWRIADNDVESHIEDVLWFVCVKELVSMGFQIGATLVCFLTGSAVPATAISPGVFHSSETDVTFEVVKGFADRILPVRRLRIVHRPTRKRGGQIRDGESIKLVLEDVINPLLAVGDLSFQSSVETLGDLA